MTVRTYCENALQPNSVGAETGIVFPISGNIHELTTEFFKRAYPAKTWAGIANFLGLSERVAKHRIAGTRGYSAEEILTIIFSEKGARYIAWLSRNIDENNKADWLQLHEPLMELADVERAQLVLRSRTAKVLRRTVDADDELTATIRRAEAAAIHDAEHTRPHLDALRAMGGVPHRTVAQKVGRRK